MLSSLVTVDVRRGGNMHFPFEIETKHQDSLENMKLVSQF